MDLWLKRFLLVAVLTLSFSGTARGETRIMQVTDLHYLSPALYEGSDLFLRSMAAADGKFTQESGQMLAGLVKEATHQRPDALIITGDLSFNGEKQSHEEIALALGEIEDAGIPVYIIPGNHDINSEGAYRFEGDSYSFTSNVTPKEFEAIYAEFGFDDNFSRDTYTKSYAVKIKEDVWLAMLDVSIYQDEVAASGFYGYDIQKWFESVLKDADAAGARLLTATHQSLLSHSDRLTIGYKIYYGEDLLAPLLARKASLHLTGHIHVQHLTQLEGLTDAALSAFCVSPHHYAMVTYADDGSVIYDVKPLCKEHVDEDFLEQSEALFLSVTANKMLRQLQKTEATEAEKEQMADFAARVNHAYFAGNMANVKDMFLSSSAWALWEKWGEGISFYGYMQNLLAQDGRDMMHLELR